MSAARALVRGLAPAALAAASALPAATPTAPAACRASPAPDARPTLMLRAGEPLQLLSLQRDWALVRRERAEPCWTPSRGIAQAASDVRSITRYSAVAGPVGRVELDPAAKAGPASDCPCGSGRSCKGPAGNRYCISRGVLTTRTR